MELLCPADAKGCCDDETVGQGTLQTPVLSRASDVLSEVLVAVDSSILLQEDNTLQEENLAQDEDVQVVTEAPSLHEDAEKTDAATIFRTRSKSWLNLPQERRGITLHEIQEFHDPERAWLTTAQMCRGCNKLVKLASCTCGSERAALRMPNLYEVNERMIMPACKPRQVSYVELLHCEGKVKLATGTGAPGKEVDTFVSHWWGHEFHLFVEALHRFCLTGNLARRRKDRHSPRAFWICAFANNQFAVEHALGDGDATTSSFANALRSPSCKEVIAVLDDDGSIYSRIWCAFELFCVSKLVPLWTQKDVPIHLVNHLGVVSFGDVTFKSMLKMRSVIQSIKTSEARASHDEDKRLIYEAMQKQNTTYEDLDSHLVELAWRGVLACRQRQSIVLGLLFGSASPSLAYDLAMVAHNMSAATSRAAAAVWLLRLVILLVFILALPVLFATVRGLPRVGRFGSIAHRERFVARSVLSPENVFLACCYLCSGPCSEHEKRMEKRLWYLFFCLALPQLLLSVLLFGWAESASGLAENLNFMLIDASSLLVTALYVGFGVFYQILRPRPFFTSKRQRIEDFLFAG